MFPFWPQFHTVAGRLPSLGRDPKAAFIWPSLELLGLFDNDPLNHLDVDIDCQADVFRR
jgi:hypothetical protein